MNTVTTTPTQAPPTHWPLERILMAMAGTMSLLSALLAAIVSPWFLLLTGFVGVSQCRSPVQGVSDHPVRALARERQEQPVSSATTRPSSLGSVGLPGARNAT